MATVKVEKIDPKVVTEKEREERRQSYLNEARSRAPVPMVGVNSDSPAPAPAPVLAASSPAMSSDAMVDAGIRVSKWYLDYIASQRPKGG